MSTPLLFEIEQTTNEDFDVTIPFQMTAADYPFVTGTYFEADIRKTPKSTAVLSFASVGSGRQSSWWITPIWDSVNNVLNTQLYAPADAVALIPQSGSYVMDIRIIKPTGLNYPQISVIANGPVTILDGVTYDVLAGVMLWGGINNIQWGGASVQWGS